MSLSVPEKSITALIGPSGCGKSTFLKTLDRMNDLIPGVRVEGQVLYRGEDIYAPSVDVNQLRREVGMVFQKPNPFPMSIYDNVAYGPRTHGVRNRAQLDGTVRAADGRAYLRAGSYLHLQNRRACNGTEKEVHYRYRDAQHAAGAAHFR